MIALLSLLGAGVALLTYVLTANNKIVPHSYPFHSLHLLSCLLLGYVGVITAVPGFILLNVVWGWVALFNLFKVWKSNEKIMELSSSSTQSKN